MEEQLNDWSDELVEVIIVSDDDDTECSEHMTNNDCVKSEHDEVNGWCNEVLKVEIVEEANGSEHMTIELPNVQVDDAEEMKVEIVEEGEYGVNGSEHMTTELPNAQVHHAESLGSVENESSGDEGWLPVEITDTHDGDELQWLQVSC